MSEDEPRIRTYGGWRRSQQVGLFGLSSAQTLGLLATLGLLLIVAAFSPLAAGILLLPAAVAGGGMWARWDGIPLTHLLVQQARWAAARRAGYDRLDAGLAVEHPQAWTLPGVLAPTTLVSADDGAGGDYGLVWDRRSGLVTATLEVAPASTWLADPADADGWVANWGGWLAGLGYVPAVRWVAVTVTTAPDPGSTLADSVAARLAPDAPPLARGLMAELVAAAPAAAADVDTYVSVTFDPRLAPSRPADLPSTAAEFGHTLTGLESSLGACGVAVVGRATAAAIAGVVRTAYDPHARGEINRMMATGSPDLLNWADAGPVTAVESHGQYDHDGAYSVSWSWREAPRQQVPAHVLARLIAPGRWPRRVTLLYRPLSAGDAARVLEREVTAASFKATYRAQTGRDATARDTADAHRAHRAAAEEALGAGVTLMSLYVTTTVLDASELPVAVADVESRADESKIRLRRMYGSQAAGFATTLPCGICPPVLSRRWPH
ncbi:hypothetical protein FDG2_0596 [Candidatus Protofrankia californiensis]|uniref:Integral membrane protein n=1 Tax=Candidatus Protofrankia californiensis TaxID=1839754 RepID=A0A1C3NTZ0_9ACTN|nr:hypothetical protein FDG2_0596 [Candidatus Protofrankia californiensis]